MAVVPTRNAIFLWFLCHFPPFFQKTKTRLNIPGFRRMTSHWRPTNIRRRDKKKSRSVRACGHLTVSKSYIKTVGLYSTVHAFPQRCTDYSVCNVQYYTTVFALVFWPVLCLSLNRTNSESNLYVPVTCGGYLTSRIQQPSTHAAVTYQVTRLYLQTDRPTDSGCGTQGAVRWT
jgi:hypothetical protein